jgi:mono/diheme cytochrome c family protein
MKHVLLLSLALGIVACQPLPSADPSLSANQHSGLAFAQGACGGCHSVERYELSPNPNAPPFAAIINRENLTPATLSAWLRDAHNYPEEMEFYLEGREVDDLVAYMLTLRDADFRPTI